jgi:TolA-binding protein
LEDADPSLRLERDLLKRLNSEQPPSGSVDRGWAALSAEIAGVHAIGAAASVASGSAQGTHAAAASSAGVGIATKLVAGVALSGGLLWGGAALLKTQGESTLTAPQLVSTPAHTQPRGVTVAPAAPPSVESQTRDAAESADQPLAPARRAPLATTLAEEGRLLARANALVQSGHARQALDLLHESESRYPQSTLYQEREVLTVEALAASGAKSAAKQRAERFLKRYPNSPHAGKLQTFVQ